MTETTFDEDGGYQTTKSYEDDKLVKQSWTMVMKCSGKVGTPGKFVEPPSPSTNGEPAQAINPSVTQTQFVTYDGANVRKGEVPNIAVWRTSLQRGCDRIFEGNPR
jgi:hypothetical protein